MMLYHINWPGKSGHLDNQDTFYWSQGVHNTQVPLYNYKNKGKLYAGGLREREKHRNVSHKKRATTLVISKLLAQPVSPLDLISLNIRSTKPMCTCTTIVQSQLQYTGKFGGENYLRTTQVKAIGEVNKLKSVHMPNKFLVYLCLLVRKIVANSSWFTKFTNFSNFYSVWYFICKACYCPCMQFVMPLFY